MKFNQTIISIISILLFLNPIIVLLVNVFDAPKYIFYICLFLTLIAVIVFIINYRVDAFVVSILVWLFVAAFFSSSCIYRKTSDGSVLFLLFCQAWALSITLLRGKKIFEKYLRKGR